MTGRGLLALNAGSSSLKFALADIGPDGSRRPTLSGQVEAINTAPHLVARDCAGNSLADQRLDAGEPADHGRVLGSLIDWIEGHLGAETIEGVGHRIVHGGRQFTAPVRLTREILGQLEALTPLAPLHQPGSLAPVRALMRLRPDLPQVGCFDTAFHHAMPASSARFALPRRFEQDGVRRYGFHGLSYEYVARHLRQTAPDLAAGRVVAAHLGNGASLCAMKDGRSLDTTMGFTALDGLVMGTRCGSLDPGIVLYMLREKHMSADEVEHVLYHESGLLGVSGGLSSDMRDLLASPERAAAEAVELFVARIAREVAAMAASLRGLDGLVFTGGIGEHAAAVRAAVCERLAWLGITLDATANHAGQPRISAPSSRITALVVPTDEEATILRHTQDILARVQHPTDQGS